MWNGRAAIVRTSVCGSRATAGEVTGGLYGPERRAGPGRAVRGARCEARSTKPDLLKAAAHCELRAGPGAHRRIRWIRRLRAVLTAESAAARARGPGGRRTCLRC